MRNVQFLGKMPDPFKKEDGTRMTPAEWQEKRGEIRDMIVDIEYGGMPPRPEVVKIERVSQPRMDAPNVYKVWAGTKEKQVSF